MVYGCVVYGWWFMVGGLLLVVYEWWFYGWWFIVGGL